MKMELACFLVFTYAPFCIKRKDNLELRISLWSLLNEKRCIEPLYALFEE